jgi:hypothetical protein
MDELDLDLRLLTGGGSTSSTAPLDPEEGGSAEAQGTADK